MTMPQSTLQSTPLKTLIRDMTRADVERVGEILFQAFNYAAASHGYPPRINSVQEGKSWAWAVLRHHPGEYLIAEVENRAAGICCLNPRGPHGGVGPVAVDPAFHRCGIGTQLMNNLLQRAEGLESVRLFQESFNPASFSLYYKLGLMPVAEMMDVFLNAGERKSATKENSISESTGEDLDRLCAYDMPRSRMDRRTDLAYYLKWGKIITFGDGSKIRGFLACLPGSQSVQLGPLVAEGEEEAACLFQHAAGIYHDRVCQTRVMARDYVLNSALSKLGFRLYCLNLLMVRGSWQPGVCIEAFGRFPEGA